MQSRVVVGSFRPRDAVAVAVAVAVDDFRCKAARRQFFIYAEDVPGINIFGLLAKPLKNC